LNVLTQQELSPTPPTPNISRVFTIQQWPHQYPTEAGFRWLIFHAATNGFDSCIRRVGRRILIDEAAFYRWLEAQNGKPMKIAPMKRKIRGR
jgi:hypothetical protein